MRTKKTTSPLTVPLPPILLVLLLGLAGPAASAAADLPEGSCVPDATTLCLDSNRFSVEVEWDDTMSSGAGQVGALATDDTGFFTYQEPQYLDLMIKVLDACSFNDRFWVFTAGLSDAIQTITVTDTSLGTIQTYNNMLGSFPNFADTDALPCTPPFTSPFARSRSTKPAKESPVPEGPLPTTLSQVEGRFQVEVDWEDFEMGTGPGVPVEFSDFSGVFWFFSPASLELILKIVDGSSDNGFYQVFASATANIEYTIEITDICTGAFQSYTHPLGGSLDTIVDLTAFSTAGTPCDIFADGFETGDTTLWSVTVP